MCIKLLCIFSLIICDETLDIFLFRNPPKIVFARFFPHVFFLSKFCVCFVSCRYSHVNVYLFNLLYSPHSCIIIICTFSRVSYMLYMSFFVCFLPLLLYVSVS
jgi:hypothetical protein